jgi:hypothetical protein
VLQWRPQPEGERPVNGFPHFLDDGGYLSDGQHPLDDRRKWHGKNLGLSINRGLCIPNYFVPADNDLDREQVTIPCLLIPNEKGLPRKYLSDEDQFEGDTDVHVLYLWDDTTVNNFTTNRARLDKEHGQQTEFPKDASENRLRMHPDKLARRRDLLVAVVEMLGESTRPPQRCRNFSAAKKWHERLLQNHSKLLNDLRRQLNFLNPTFPLAFALSARGRGLQSADAVWEAILACTTQTGRVEYVDPPQRDRPATPAAQTVLTDVPVHASLHFKRNDNRSKFQRAVIANTIRAVVAYSVCLPYVHGMTIHHDKSCHDKDWMNKNILWLMGHEFDTDTQEQINRRLHLQHNMWRNGLFVSHMTSFSPPIIFYERIHRSTRVSGG